MPRAIALCCDAIARGHTKARTLLPKLLAMALELQQGGTVEVVVAAEAEDADADHGDEFEGGDIGDDGDDGDDGDELHGGDGDNDGKFDAPPRKTDLDADAAAAAGIALAEGESTAA
jgi:hypothetical protein